MLTDVPLCRQLTCADGYVGGLPGPGPVPSAQDLSVEPLCGSCSVTAWQKPLLIFVWVLVWMRTYVASDRVFEQELAVDVSHPLLTLNSDVDMLPLFIKARSFRYLLN
jgi:hypothetical protein